MKLTFIGADHEVTGSCHCLQACDKNILIDCGMEQGQDVYENQELPMNPSEVDYILLTHAHIDHTGLLPLMYARGFRGKVYTTKATTDLCNIMLRDSAHIQEFEAEWRNRKARRAGEEEYVPLYSMNDAIGALEHFIPCEYDEIIEIDEGIKIRFSDVGHLLGSASIEVWMTEADVSKKIVFSGDIGNMNQPIIKNPQYLKEADYVVMESTYGDRNHGGTPDYVAELTKIIKETFDRGGNLVIPSFAVGRTQELLYFIRKIKVDNLLPEYEDFEVYVDSPLAVEATNIFNRNVESCFDEEAMELVRKGINPISFPGLKTSVTSSDSKSINFSQKSKVIISASGMCEAGRIRHHLKHNLWRKDSTILFVGYQAHGTLGRSILEGATNVKLFGEVIEVKAKIEKLDGISGHADQEGLLRWLHSFEPKPKVFVVHGEDTVCESFKTMIQNQGYEAIAPFSGAEFDLATNELIFAGIATKKVKVSQKAFRARAIFDRLVAAGNRLLVVIAHNRGGANKDLIKFTDQINSLCDKWDR
ncbi:MAG: MBL fold metallo-hydrolase [Eubacteriales bacterium]|nr:MBL fold metallo-hydrolase [Eubacteriales bacterium]